MMDKRQTIAIYGHAQSEIDHRRFSGAIRYCQENQDFLLRDFRVAEDRDDFDRTPPCWKGRADGVVLAVGRPPDITDKRLADWVESGGVPAVSFVSDWIDARIPIIFSDPRAMAKVAAQHLVECDCQSFLYVGFASSTGSTLRGQALQAELARRRRKLVQYEAGARFLGSFEDEAKTRGEKKLRQLLKTLPKPLGVWALNDNFASAVCMICAELKLEIPAAVRVLGVGDTRLSREHSPALSTIRTPDEEIGYMAMRTLHRLLTGKSRVRKTTTVSAMELIARGSTGQPTATTGDLQDVLDYIARHACSGVDLDQLTEIVGTSRRTLEERFRRTIGHTLGEEIIRVRLEQAKDLLKSTEISLGRIATMVGYNESAAFSKFFRKNTGLSPRSYRAGAIPGRR
jgi:LacI family transcriptional regulator